MGWLSGCVLDCCWRKGWGGAEEVDSTGGIWKFEQYASSIKCFICSVGISTP